MATTSFTKTFKVRKKDADAFVKHMTEPSKPLLPKGYKSHFRRLNSPEDIKRVEQALAND